MSHETKTIGIASGLVALNVALMAAVSISPLAGLMDYVFSYLILGVLFFGVLLSGGVWLARKGVRQENMSQTFLGIAVLQGAYGLFGGGVLSWIPTELYTTALTVTFAVTLGITVLSAALVYFTGRDFSRWGMYSTYIFLGVLAMALFGTFIPFFGVITFSLALLGFLVYLIHEIYILREQETSPLMNGLGIYVAFMGVFVQILQMVIRYYLER